MRKRTPNQPLPKLTLYGGRYYCDQCLASAVKDQRDRVRMHLPPLIKKRAAHSRRGTYPRR